MDDRSESLKSTREMSQTASDTDNVALLLRACPNRFALAVLQPFIEQNDIDSERLIALNRILREARENKVLLRSGKIVWEALAIFALYAYFEVTDMADIAEYLCLTTATVKRWVSAVYSAFHLEQEGFPDRAARRRKLRVQIMEDGYTKYPSWLRRRLEAFDNPETMGENEIKGRCENEKGDKQGGMK